MAKGKIELVVVRKVDYDSNFNRLYYRAIVRVYLKPFRGHRVDLSLVRLRATSPAGLEKKIRLLKRRFTTLLKKHPEFIKKIAEVEKMSVDEEDV